jgi:spore coat protein U-like protein
MNGLGIRGVAARKLSCGRVRFSLVGIGGLAALVASGNAGALTATNTFTVQAIINAACLVSATLLNFGSYDPTSGTALNGTSTVNVFCTGGTPYTTTLNIGTGGGTFATRTLLNGANTLNYNLFKDSAHAQIWGDGTSSTFTVTGTGNGILTANPITVYGQITTGQDKPVGTYASIITVTVTY